MVKKLLETLLPKDSLDKIKKIEGKVFDFEIDTSFEGGATFSPRGKIIKNAKGDYILKEGTTHRLNLSKYLKGKFSSVYEVRIYKKDS